MEENKRIYMEIRTFINQFDLHDSYIENIGSKSFNDSLIVTLNFCNWAQINYKESEPENIIGNLIFQEVNDLQISNQYFAIHDNRILDVRLDGLDILTFVIEVPEPEGITLLSFRAQSVVWEPFCLTFEKRLMSS